MMSSTSMTCCQSSMPGSVMSIIMGVTLGTVLTFRLDSCSISMLNCTLSGFGIISSASNIATIKRRDERSSYLDSDIERQMYVKACDEGQARSHLSFDHTYA